MNLFLLYDHLYNYLVLRGIKFNEYGFPIFRKEMFTNEIPEEILPFKNRSECKNKKKTALCTFQIDHEVYPKLFSLEKNLEEWKQYLACIVFDLSPRIEWKTSVQKFNICLNQMASIYLALNGVKLIANLRVGGEDTFCALESYPSGINYAVGTLGCTKYSSEEDLIYFQCKLVLSAPKYLLIYGTLDKDTKDLLEGLGIKYRVYPSRRELIFLRRKRAA